jgi:16S rRNA processing protein RimM
MERWLRAGRVGGPHGLDGSFHVLEATAQLLDAGNEVLVCGHTRRIERRAGHERRVILRLEGIGDRDAAAALRGEQMLVDRARAPALEEDEWWAQDLEGCEVRVGDRRLGVVARLLAMPACEVLEVAQGAEGQDVLLVPLVSDAVRAVDVGRRRIEVDAGFLALEE